MLLAVDVGNTQTSIGLFLGEELIGDWRISTQPWRTSEEYMVILAELLRQGGWSLDDITGIAVASVVPEVSFELSHFVIPVTKIKPLFLDAKTIKSVQIKLDNPEEIGADRLANAVAAYHMFGGSCIIVDFGTAITFDVIDDSGAYLGGAIAPGIESSMEGLAHKAARLSRIPLEHPRSAIGKNTIESMRSGLILGFASLVDGMIDKISVELPVLPTVIATGGYSELVTADCHKIEHHDPHLTLKGLKILYQEIA